MVIGPGIAALLEAPNRIHKINHPADEQRQHQPVHVDYEVVDILPVGRGQWGHAQQISPPFHHILAPGKFSSANFFACAAASRRMRTTKNVAIELSMSTTMPSSVKIPAFMPYARGALDLP